MFGNKMTNSFGEVPEDVYNKIIYNPWDCNYQLKHCTNFLKTQVIDYYKIGNTYLICN